MLRTKCKINVEYFPFDSQQCIMKFGSWTYDGFRLDVQNESSSIKLTMYVKSAEWHLSSAPAQRGVAMYDCCPEPYPDVTFTVNIQRRTLFYLTNLILPLIVISVLITFVFALPPESGKLKNLARSSEYHTSTNSIGACDSLNYSCNGQYHIQIVLPCRYIKKNLTIIFYIPNNWRSIRT